jgi:large subunit ribosomal protein L35
VPKIKSHKATAKRFKLTGSGKLVRTKGYRSHLRRNRSRRAKQAAWEMLDVETPGEVKRIKRLLPYLSKNRG